MAALDSLSKITLDQVSAVSKDFTNYIVRPLNAFGLGGFVFDVEGATTVNFQAEITDHYTEDNTAIQDHIAIKPIKITLKNYVGELVYRPEGEGNTIVQDVTRKLTIISSYLPQLTSAAKQLKNIYTSKNKFSLKDLSGKNLLSNTDKITDMWALIKNLTPPIPRQAQAFMFFEALFNQKILLSVQTPFKFYTNMVIESISAVQEEESRYISEFSITLKQLRFAEVKTAKFKEAEYKSGARQDRSDIQASPANDVIKTQGAPIGETPTEVIIDETPKDASILTGDGKPVSMEQFDQLFPRN